MAPRQRDPIRRVELADGTVRYRFVIDMGKRADGRRDQRTFTFDSMREARAERARIISERADGRLVRPNRKLTVREYFEGWIESKVSKKPSTIQCYRDALRPLIDLYGHLPLQQLDVPHLERIKKGMLAGELRRVGKAGAPLSPRTVNLFLTSVTTALKAAVKRRLLAVNVGECVDRVESDPDAGADRGQWELVHVQAFLAHVRGHRLAGAFFLSLCGLRRGEVLGLCWPAVTLSGDSPELTVRRNRVQVDGQVYEGTPKSKASRRTLPLVGPMLTALTQLQLRQREELEEAGEAYQPDCPLCGEAHVVADELGRPYRPEWYSDEFERQLQAARKVADLPRVPLHGSRHAAASLLGAMGLPILDVAAHLGQSQISVTAGYQHASRAGLSDVALRISDVLTGRV
ncbi:MAG: site-specific integrase [Natronosporangium sp.]